MATPMRKSSSQQPSNASASPALSLHKRLPSATNLHTTNSTAVAAAAANNSSRPSTPAAAIGGVVSTPKSHAMAKSMSAGTTAGKSFGSPAAASQASPITNVSTGRSPAVSSSAHSHGRDLHHGPSSSAAAAASASTPLGPGSVPHTGPSIPGATPTSVAHAASTGPTHATIGFDSPSILNGFMQGLEGAAAGAGAGSAPGMALSLSSLGLTMAQTASAMGRAQDDDERRRRLESVLASLRRRPGRISRQGLERLGRRCEMDVVPEGPDKLSLGGRNSVVLDVEFAPNQSPSVERVALSFPSASDAMTEHVDKASKILHRDLTPPTGVSAINATLDRFANNLERLATLDKLSAPGADCFEAIIGVYSSLRKLYEHEKSAALHLFGADDTSAEHGRDAHVASLKARNRRAELEVMCAKSGRPAMHTRDRVGLSLDYWSDGRLLPPPKFTSAANGAAQKNSDDGADAMAVDSATSNIASSIENANMDCADDEQVPGSTIYSLVLECEASSPALYPPIRVSSEWLPTNIMKPKPSAAAANLDEGTGILDSEDDTKKPVAAGKDGTTTEGSAESAGAEIDWQEPEPPVLPKPEPLDPGEMSDAQPVHLTQPQARFVARFEPPAVVPAQVAIQIYAAFGLHWPPVNLPADAAGPFDQLVLGQPTTTTASADSTLQLPLNDPHQPEPHHYRSMLRAFSSFDAGGTASRCRYRMGLYTSRAPDLNLSIVIESLPFTHPRQLIEILPTLRQYAMAASLLKRTFLGDTTSESAKGSLANSATTAPPLSNGSASKKQPEEGSDSEASPSTSGSDSDSVDSSDDGDHDDGVAGYALGESGTSLDDELEALLGLDGTKRPAARSAKLARPRPKPKPRPGAGEQGRIVDTYFSLHSMHPASLLKPAAPAEGQQQVRPYFTLLLPRHSPSTASSAGAGALQGSEKRRSSGPRKVLVAVSLNGRVEILAQDLFVVPSMDSAQGAQQTDLNDMHAHFGMGSSSGPVAGAAAGAGPEIGAGARLRRLRESLETCEDFAVWAEFIRLRHI